MDGHVGIAADSVPGLFCRRRNGIPPAENRKQEHPHPFFFRQPMQYGGDERVVPAQQVVFVIRVDGKPGTA